MRNNIYPPSIHWHGMFIKTIWPGYHNHQIISGGESIIGRSNDAGGNIHVCSNWVFIGSVSPKLIILRGQLSINSNISSPQLSVLFSLYSHSIHSNLSRLESEKRKKDSVPLPLALPQTWQSNSILFGEFQLVSNSQMSRTETVPPVA